MFSPLRTRVMRANASVIAAAIIGLAFFLRVYRLADSNIWWDEGWTIWLARYDLVWIALRTASDEHPPLHYWLMHFWLAPGNFFAGAEVQAFAGRFVSVSFGLLTVALLSRIGRRIGGNALGLVAALLLALARFHVWWSQDIKNYTLSGFFALASVWFVLEIVRLQVAGYRLKVADKEPPGHSGSEGLQVSQAEPSNLPTFQRSNLYPWLWVGYVASITLALYSHYLAGLIFMADNLFVFIVLLREWRAGRATATVGKPREAVPTFRWIIAQLAVLALFAPWLALYLQNAATWGAAPPFDLSLFLRLAGTVFALGVTTYIENYAWVVLGFTLLAALGAVWAVAGLRQNSRNPLHGFALGSRSIPSDGIGWGALFALVIVLVPAALIYVLSLTPAAVFAPKIQARYLLILLPAYMLLIALGILFLSRNRYVAAVALVLVAAAQTFTLNDYFHERVLRDEYFTLANVVNAFVLPGDGIVLNTDQEWPTFLYYLRQPLAWVGVPNGTRVDATVAHRVAVQAQQFRAVWVVTIPDALDQDPQHLVEAELARYWGKQYEQTIGDKRLTLYAAQVRNVKDVPPENFAPQFARADEFDSRLSLSGVDLPVREAQPGDTARVVTYWASEDLANVRVSLRRPDGVIVADQTVSISIGAHERAQADLVVPPDTPSTELYVVAQARLKQMPIGSIRITPRGVESGAGAMTRALDYRLGESFRLVGDDLPRREFRTGDSSTGSGVPLTLFWKTDRPVTTSYTAFVHLLGAQYNPVQDNFLWGQVDRIPVEGRLPTSAWTPGQLIADPYSIPIQANAPPGLYRIEVGLYEAATGTRLRVFDANGKEVGDAAVVGEVEIR
jgi:uncharacterized membrane protein